MSDREQLARLQVAIATGRLPRDLGAWALGRILEGLAAAERRRHRDELLRSAADQIPGSIWAKAIAIHAMLEEFRSKPGLIAVAWYAPDSAAALLQAASRIDPRRPKTRRQVLRIVGSDISPP